MYAVIKTGGKQYKVAPGEKLKVEQLPADVGAAVVLDQVLMVGDGDSVRLGQPTVAGATVTATVLAHGRGEKLRIFKMRRRKHYQKHQGHRQGYTELQDRRYRRLTLATNRTRQWHTKKQAAVPATGAIRIPSASA